MNTLRTYEVQYAYTRTVIQSRHPIIAAFEYQAWEEFGVSKHEQPWQDNYLDFPTAFMYSS